MSWDETSEGERRRRVSSEQNDKCSICYLSGEWNDKPLKLQYDHIDGDRSNNNRSNVRFICPNCHTQTPTYCHSSTKKFTDEEIRNALIKNKLKISTSLSSLGLVPGGYNWDRAKKIIFKYKLDALVGELA